MSHHERPTQAEPLPNFPNMPDPKINYRELAELGLSFFPVAPREKRPSISSWKKFQLRHPNSAEVQKWSSNLSNNVGIVTGKISNCFVLDVDDKDMVDVLKKRGLPKTLTASTSKGYHYFFKHPGIPIPNATKLIPGCDIRGDGGYVVGAGSVHPTGAVYEWVTNPSTTPLVPAPTWLLDEIQRKSNKVSETPANTPNAVSNRILARKLEKLLEKIEVAPNGTRNDTLNRVAYAFGQCVGHKSITREWAETQLNQAARLSGLDSQEISHTIRSGLEAGIQNPADLSAAANRKTSSAAQLIQIANGTSVFASPGGKIFADICVRGHRETYPVRSSNFRNYLIQQFFEEFDLAPSAASLESTLGYLEAKARTGGDVNEVYVRVGSLGERLYLDLCDQNWNAVEIDATGWRVVSNPPVHFQRPPGMLPLPTPSRNGTIDPLKNLLNLKSESDFVLAVSWILGALGHPGPYPILVVTGEQGTAKSTFTRLLRSLIDPSKPSLRNLSQDDHDLFVTAGNSHIIALDNISQLTPEMSDSLCRLSTGGGYRTRKLYTDDEETIIEAINPIIINGIVDFASRADLVDRAMFVTLEPISESERLTERELKEYFELQHPTVLGALLDAMAHGLNQLPDIQLPRAPRMADFARLATACETSLFTPGSFLTAYSRNRDEGAECVIENDMIATAIRQIMTERTAWTGTASNLLLALNKLDENALPSRYMPSTPSMLSSQLRRVSPSLRSEGIDVCFHKEGRARTRTITITQHIRTEEVSKSAPAPSASGNSPSSNSNPGSRSHKLRQELILLKELVR